MFLGNFSTFSIFSIFIQAVFIENILLFNFLGMCSFLACSSKIKIARGLGFAVTIVITITGTFNWVIHNFVTKKGALTWISKNLYNIDLKFLELIIFVATIAAFVQILEIIIDKYFPILYEELGIYLPLITVNCAILGVSLFASQKSMPFIPNFFYVLGTGLGWWLVIVLMAAIREKIKYSKIVKGLKGSGITFIIAGMMSLGFMSLAGISLENFEKKDISDTGYFISKNFKFLKILKNLSK